MSNKEILQNYLRHLPHGEQIQVVKEIISLDSHNICCKISAQESIFDAIEYIAQSAAVGRIANAQNAHAKLGMIVRIKEFEIFSSNAVQGSRADRVQCSWSDSIAGAYEVRGNVFSIEGNLIASAIMTMMEQT